MGVVKGCDGAGAADVADAPLGRGIAAEGGDGAAVGKAERKLLMPGKLNRVDLLVDGGASEAG